MLNVDGYVLSEYECVKFVCGDVYFCVLVDGDDVVCFVCVGWVDVLFELVFGVLLVGGGW